MNKGLIGVIAVVVLALIYGVSVNNSLVELDEASNKAWANVQAAYQRRADLIPNLVATVKGYAAHEKETLEAVIEARAKASQITIDPSKATPEQLQAYANAQGELSQALGRLLAVSESYPDLKANQNFMSLQVELEGTENRINESRRQFNSAVETYNVAVRQFPGSVVASIIGFNKKAMFEADASAQSAPKVSF